MSNPQQPLSEVLYWFSLEQTKPTAALIDEYRERFPEYADAILEFALDLTVDALLPDVPECDAETLAQPPSAIVMQSISHYQNARYQVEKERQSNVTPLLTSEKAPSGTDLFGSLKSTQLRQLARDIGVTSIFVAKLRDRQIIPETIPSAFTQQLAETLGAPMDVVMAHLSAMPPQTSGSIFYKAIDKPVRQPRETFEDAVRTSKLSSEQQDRLLSL